MLQGSLYFLLGDYLNTVFVYFPVEHLLFLLYSFYFNILRILTLSVIWFANSSHFSGLSNELSQPDISSSGKCELCLVPVNHVENR